MACPFSHRCLWMMREKGIDMQKVFIGLGQPRPDWYKNLNPFETTPAIVDEGRSILESLNIAQYLDEKFCGNGPCFMPQDCTQRAQVRMVMNIWEDMLMQKLYSLLREKDENKRQQKIEEVIPYLEQFDQIYGGYDESGPFCLGNNLSMAEISIMPFFLRLSPIFKQFFQFELLKHTPNVSQALDIIKGRQAFQETCIEEQFYVRAGEQLINKT